MKSTLDRILALRVLTERLRDFRTGLLAAYVALRKVFDSVNRDVLWRILAFRGIPPKLVSLLSGLYSGTKSPVSCDGTISTYFPVNNVVRQGCVLAPILQDLHGPCTGKDVREVGLRRVVRNSPDHFS